MGPHVSMDLSMPKKISAGVAHTLPSDLRTVLIAHPKTLETWEDITPLARNEWICWVQSVKTPETRKQHIERLRDELAEGKRRPCCWPGCMHRKDKPLNATQKFLLSKRTKK